MAISSELSTVVKDGSWLIRGMVILLFYGVSNDTYIIAVQVEPKKELPSVMVGCDTYAHKLSCLTNENREDNGKTKLKYSLELEKVSQEKSKL